MRNLNKLKWLPKVARNRYALLGLLLGSGFTSAIGQTTYYVASSGNDANNGRSADAPFQTLAKMNTVVLQAGDQVLFRRGDTFYGTLQVRQSGANGRPIVIDAYGSGSKPVLSGATPVNNWATDGNNLWYAKCPTCGNQVNGVYRDNAALPLGRFPNPDAANKGYLTVQSHVDKTQLTSQQPLATNWVGAEAVYRPFQWILNKAPISQQSGNTLTLNNPTKYHITDNWGFFIQNHIATLDQTGEWYYRPSDKTIWLYSDANPNGQNISATVASQGVSLTNANYVTIRNIVITKTMNTGLSISNGSNIVLSDNEVSHSEDGILLTGTGNTILVENNLIEHINNNGFLIQPYQNFTFRGNTIRRVGLVPGRGRSDDGNYIGFQSFCTANTLIENNILDEIGYNALNFSNNSVIQRNRISNFCLTKSDGSGLYIWNGNKQPMANIRLVSNVVFNGIGVREGTWGMNDTGANGIYLDDCTQNIEVIDNSVFDCKGYGFYLHGSSNIKMTGNTAFNNGEGQLVITDIKNACSPRNNIIQNNILVSKLPGQVGVKYESSQNDLNSFGQFDSNVYARPFDDITKIRAIHSNGSTIVGADLSLAEWQSRWSSDLNSSNSPLTYKPFVITGTGPARIDNTFPANTQGWGTWGPNGNGQAIWDNTGRLDGSSLRIAFSPASGKSDSYVIATNNIGSVSAGKTYLLRFDAIASGANKRVQAFIRQQGSPYRDLDARSLVMAGTNRQSYEMAFTPTADEASAILVFQVNEDGQTVWLDNIRLIEATRQAVNPDDCLRLVYNTTASPSQVTLDGIYRDARNNVQTGQLTLAPFSSMVLLKQTAEASAPQVTTSTVTLREPENPANAVAGLDYGYYEGFWSVLPNFDALTPVKTGTTSTPALSMRNRDLDFAIQFKGYINVPADGTYTFYTSSDDGSKMYIGNTEVVNNDGLHGEQERSGTIGLKAGRHALTIGFLQSKGGHVLNVSYSGPNLSKQLIPATAFFRVQTTVTPPPSPTIGTGSGTGLRGEYFGNRTLSAPVVLTRTDGVVSFDWGNGSPATGTIGVDNFSVRWTGQVEAPATGGYVFSTTSDDGVRLWVNGKLLIDNWTYHAPTTNNSQVVVLTAGQKYDIRMEYFENTVGAVAKLLWAYPGQKQQVIPQSRLYPAAAGSPSGRLAADEPASVEDLRVYPVPARDELRLQYFAKTNGDATVQLLDLTAQPVIQSVLPVVAGENTFRLPVSKLKRGLYVLSLTQGQHRMTQKIILEE